jgi:hypothetical protein
VPAVRLWSASSSCGDSRTCILPHFHDRARSCRLLALGRRSGRRFGGVDPSGQGSVVYAAGEMFTWSDIQRHLPHVHQHWNVELRRCVGTMPHNWHGQFPGVWPNRVGQYPKTGREWNAFSGDRPHRRHYGGTFRNTRSVWRRVSGNALARRAKKTMPIISRLVGIAALLGAGACGRAAAADAGSSPTLPIASQPKPGTPVAAVVNGGPVSAPVATTLQVSATIVDSVNVPVPNAIVNFVVTSGGGSVFAPAVQSSALGIASEQWTLGTRAAAQTLEARWINPATGAPRVLGVVTAVATPGPATLLRGTPVTVALRVNAAVALSQLFTLLDQYNNSVGLGGTAFTPSGGWVIRSDSAVAPSSEGKASLTASLGSLSARVAVASVRSLRQNTFLMDWACLHSDTWRYNGREVDSSVSHFVSDSVRELADPGPRRGLIIWRLPYVIYGSAATTHYMHDRSVQIQKEVLDFGIARQLPDSLDFQWVPNAGGIFPEVPAGGFPGGDGFVPVINNATLVNSPSNPFAFSSRNGHACVDYLGGSIRPTTLQLR